MMEKIRVDVLLFKNASIWGNEHIEINISADQSPLRNINRWNEQTEAHRLINSTPYHYTFDEHSKTYHFHVNTGGKNVQFSIPATGHEPLEIHSFYIQGDMGQILNSWLTYKKNTEPKEGLLTNNCAVATMDFLKEFAHIPLPSRLHHSFNKIALGISWHSFIPFPVMLPGRVVDNIRFWTRDHALWNAVSIDELSDNHPNSIIHEIISDLKSTSYAKNKGWNIIQKLRTLSSFYESLLLIDQYKNTLQDGIKKQSIQTFIDDLKKISKTFLTSYENPQEAFNEFRSAYQNIIERNKTLVSQDKNLNYLVYNLGIVLAELGLIYVNSSEVESFLYTHLMKEQWTLFKNDFIRLSTLGVSLILFTLNKLMTGNFFFFSKTEIEQKIETIERSVVYVEHAVKAIEDKNVDFTQERTTPSLN